MVAELWVSHPIWGQKDMERDTSLKFIEISFKHNKGLQKYWNLQKLSWKVYRNWFKFKCKRFTEARENAFNAEYCLAGVGVLLFACFLLLVFPGQSNGQPSGQQRCIPLRTRVVGHISNYQNSCTVKGQCEVQIVNTHSLMIIFELSTECDKNSHQDGHNNDNMASVHNQLAMAGNTWQWQQCLKMRICMKVKMNIIYIHK